MENARAICWSLLVSDLLAWIASELMILSFEKKWNECIPGEISIQDLTRPIYFNCRPTCVFQTTYDSTYDSAYDSDFRFSLHHKVSYDWLPDSDTIASENQSHPTPNDRFLSDAFKRCFRLSEVLLIKLCGLILGCAKSLSIQLFYGNLSILEFVRAFCVDFPKTLILGLIALPKMIADLFSVPETTFLTIRKQQISHIA